MTNEENKLLIIFQRLLPPAGVHTESAINDWGWQNNVELFSHRQIQIEERCAGVAWVPLPKRLWFPHVQGWNCCTSEQSGHPDGKGVAILLAWLHRHSIVLPCKSSLVFPSFHVINSRIYQRAQSFNALANYDSVRSSVSVFRWSLVLSFLSAALYMLLIWLVNFPGAFLTSCLQNMDVTLNRCMERHKNS